MAAGDIETYYEGGLWKNRVQGNQRPFDTGSNKAEVQERGRARAIADGVEHIIKNMQGQIIERNTYPRSRDKYPPRG
ncbi:DUF2188 domain-containing protein [Actinosynnema mirum]|uniref:DUF2188 domain-containing protein n=1 Tax=Actinosynnema mirum (strain ATCC 29888 / DSM 43827 / JCM 3225 / NBRC 14064 / NCIMB 13271 / NRRL B-12336 / IMRU 3971 / 101) TaxID=446462 RepID=C6WRH7_ACTMD|nr:DUF2188 domain-containing protein [Actinosynnema mirum]ACU35229.1 hypothetical protein Amir_1277 [Actinosynnema mirum DSM 43827]